MDDMEDFTLSDLLNGLQFAEHCEQVLATFGVENPEIAKRKEELNQMVADFNRPKTTVGFRFD